MVAAIFPVPMEARRNRRNAAQVYEPSRAHRPVQSVKKSLAQPGLCLGFFLCLDGLPGDALLTVEVVPET